MLLFLVDMVRRLGELQFLSYAGCVVSIGIFYARIYVLYSGVATLFPQALASQLAYMVIKQYFTCTFNYLIFDGFVFSALFLLFHLIRWLFFGALNHDELSSINDMLASTTLFRLVFLFHVFYYYSELSAFEFAVWSIMTELTMCLKAIACLTIIRCKLVPSQFAFDQTLPVATLCRFTLLIGAVCLCGSVALLTSVWRFFIAHTGAMPLICLLFDTVSETRL